MGTQSNWVQSVCQAAVIIAGLALIGYVINGGIQLAIVDPKKVDIAPLVALLGVVTTFVGTVGAGLLGLRAGQTGQAQTASAADVAIKSGQLATDTAEQAKKSAETQVTAVQTKLDSADKRLIIADLKQTSAAHQISQLRSVRGNTISKLANLKATVPAAVHAEIDSIAADGAAKTVKFKLTADAKVKTCEVVVTSQLVIDYPNTAAGSLGLQIGGYLIVWVLTGEPGASITIAITDSADTPLRAAIQDALALDEVSHKNNDEFDVA